MSLLPSIRGLPRAFWYLFGGTLINRMGSFVVPFLAIYLREQRGLTVEEAGTIVAFFGAGTLGAGLFGGQLADRMGRKRTMVLGLVSSAACMLLLSVARDVYLIGLATFLLSGLGDVYRPAMQAMLADVVPPNDRPRAYGLMYWAINLGFAIAPVAAGVLQKQGFELLFYVDASTSVAFAVLIALRVPESRPERTTPSISPLRGIAAPFSDAKFMLFGFTSLLTMLVFQQGLSMLPIDMRDHGISSETYGILIAINGVAIVLLQPFALGPISKMSQAGALALAALLMGAGFFIPAVWSSIPGYAVSIVVWTLGEIAMSPTTPAVVAGLAPVDLRGTYQGAFQVFWGASSFIAPIAGSRVLAAYGSSWLWTGALLLSLVSAMGFMLIRIPVRKTVEPPASAAEEVA